jgi:hypothetical protein
MEFNQETVVGILTLLVVGILIVAGIVLLDEFADAAKLSTNIVNESVTVTSGAGTTANDDITSISRIENQSQTWTSDSISYLGDTENACWNVSSAGTFTTNETDGAYNFTYVYDRDSATTTVVGSARDGTDDFVTWIPTIIVIIALSIILALVMREFRQ